MNDMSISTTPSRAATPAAGRPGREIAVPTTHASSAPSAQIPRTFDTITRLSTAVRAGSIDVPVQRHRRSPSENQPVVGPAAWPMAPVQTGSSLVPRV